MIVSACVPAAATAARAVHRHGSGSRVRSSSGRGHTCLTPQRTCSRGIATQPRDGLLSRRLTTSPCAPPFALFCRQGSRGLRRSAGRCKEPSLKTRIDLQGAIDQIDAAMLHASNEAPDTSQHWKAWSFATAGIPPMDEIPSDLGYWWQNQLLDASRRAFDNKDLRRRYHRGEFHADALPIDGVVWNNGPCVYRDREIRIELRRRTLGAPWTAEVTISRRHELKITDRMFFAGIPGATVMGAIGAYALVIEEAKREVDRLNGCHT